MFVVASINRSIIWQTLFLTLKNATRWSRIKSELEKNENRTRTRRKHNQRINDAQEILRVYINRYNGSYVSAISWPSNSLSQKFVHMRSRINNTLWILQLDEHISIQIEMKIKLGGISINHLTTWAKSAPNPLPVRLKSWFTYITQFYKYKSLTKVFLKVYVFLNSIYGKGREPYYSGLCRLNGVNRVLSDFNFNRSQDSRFGSKYTIFF